MPQPVYHPVVIIQYALAHFDLSLSGNLDSENVFMRCARWLEDNAVEERNQRFLVWPYTYPLRTPPVPAPWISGMAQGQALSVLARSFKKTGSKATAEAATKVSRSFLYTVAEGGVITRFADGTCFIEEIACGTRFTYPKRMSLRSVWVIRISFPFSRSASSSGNGCNCRRY